MLHIDHTCALNIVSKSVHHNLAVVCVLQKISASARFPSFWYSIEVVAPLPRFFNRSPAGPSSSSASEEEVLGRRAAEV